LYSSVLVPKVPRETVRAAGPIQSCVFRLARFGCQRAESRFQGTVKIRPRIEGVNPSGPSNSRIRWKWTSARTGKIRHPDRTSRDRGGPNLLFLRGVVFIFGPFVQGGPSSVPTDRREEWRRSCDR
jgi:hypothetical protein